MASLPTFVALAALFAPSSARQDGPPKVGFELVADVSHVAPGATFHLVARIALPKHWHVYWENPGASGLETTIEVSVPEGFEVGAVRYPGPDRFEIGELVVYGYENEVALFVPVTAPAELAPGPLTFSVDGRWLVCKESCFLGNESAALELEVRSTKPEPANVDVLWAQRERLPRPWKELAQADVEGEAPAVESTWSYRSDAPGVGLRMAIAGADELEFYPAADASLELKERSTSAKDGRAVIDLSFESTESTESSGSMVAEGVLRVRRGDQTRYYAMRSVPPASADR